MNRSITFILILLILTLSSAGAAVAGITNNIVTVSIPKDYRSAEPYKVEFTVPEGSMAFNFTLWATDKTWGIVDISGGAYKEVYSSVTDGTNGNAPVIDAESSERVTDPPSETSTTDPLSRITLLPGSYIVWMKGNPGASMTLQYNLRTSH
jgi:hypothetical protein